jgi:hypothetical protein
MSTLTDEPGEGRDADVEDQPESGTSRSEPEEREPWRETVGDQE